MRYGQHGNEAQGQCREQEQIRTEFDAMGIAVQPPSAYQPDDGQTEDHCEEDEAEILPG